MDSKWAPFGILTDDQPSQEAPRLSLEIQPYPGPGTALSITLPYRIPFTIHRSNAHTDPLVLHWSPLSNFMRCQFVLLHGSPLGLERVQFPELSPGEASEEDGTTITCSSNNVYMWELPAAGKFSQFSELTENYQKTLTPGETYHLFWPGGVMDIWEWGAMAEWQDKGLKSHSLNEARLPRVILPASNVLTFVAKEEDVPWPERLALANHKTPEGRKLGRDYINWMEWEWRRKTFPPSPPPVGPNARLPGAPFVSMKLAAPAQINCKDDLDIRIVLKYDSSDDNSKPFTFHTHIFTTIPTRGHLQRLRSGNWEKCIGQWYNPGFMIDDPDVSVMVGESKRFVSLYPGEEWTTMTTLKTVDDDDVNEFPRDTAVGDRFRFGYRGLELDWLGWGTKEDHEKTSVLLDCNRSSAVIGPKDNDGRPKLIVPAPEFIESTVAE